MSGLNHSSESVKETIKAKVSDCGFELVKEAAKAGTSKSFDAAGEDAAGSKLVRFVSQKVDCLAVGTARGSVNESPFSSGVHWDRGPVSL